jgi:hypothetical protein
MKYFVFRTQFEAQLQIRVDQTLYFTDTKYSTTFSVDLRK